MTMANRIAIMNKGINQQVDTPLAVYNNPVNLFVAGFIGSPTMNFISGTLTSKDGKLFFLTDSEKVFFELNESLFSINPIILTKKLVLGIRPEDTTITLSENNGFLKTSSVYTTELIEHMGDVSLIHISPELDINWTIKTPPQPQLKVGDEISLYLNPQKIHFFDKETGLNLTTDHNKTSMDNL
jgi:multiple sugar transport system ATP-binding protein